METDFDARIVPVPKGVARLTIHWHVPDEQFDVLVEAHDHTPVDNLVTDDGVEFRTCHLFAADTEVVLYGSMRNVATARVEAAV
jgi:hypothetical protein